MKLSQNRLHLIVPCLALIASMATGSLFAQDYVNAGLPWHDAVLDSQGRLLAWYHPEKNLGYDKFLSLDLDFLEHKVPKEGNTGLKVYLVNSVFDPETLQGIKSSFDIQHDPASLYAHMVDLLVGWYPYSGDEGGAAGGSLDAGLPACARYHPRGMGLAYCSFSRHPATMRLSTVGAFAIRLRIQWPL